MFGTLRWSAINGEGVVWAVDGAPVFDFGFEGGFDFPVFDEVFDEKGEGCGFVGLGLGWMGLVGGDGKWREGGRGTLVEDVSGIGVVWGFSVAPVCCVF